MSCTAQPQPSMHLPDVQHMCISCSSGSASGAHGSSRSSPSRKIMSSPSNAEMHARPRATSAGSCCACGSGTNSPSSLWRRTMKVNCSWLCRSDLKQDFTCAANWWPSDALRRSYAVMMRMRMVCMGVWSRRIALREAELRERLLVLRLEPPEEQSKSDCANAISASK